MSEHSPSRSGISERPSRLTFAVDVFRDNGEHFLRRQNSGLLAALRGCTDR